MEYVDSPSYFQTIWAPIASVGWYMVGLAIIAYYAFPHIQEKYKSWKFTKDQQDGHCKKTDRLSQASANVELARQRLQMEYDKSCTLAQLKEEEEKEKKRQKVVKLLESKNVGNRLGSSTDNETPGTSTNTKWKSLKSDYNPLMGNNTRGYRPPKRSCCKKGGCG